MGKTIKDLSYLKYFVIVFKYNLKHYVFCKPNDHSTFVILEDTNSTDLPSLNIFKFKTKDEATDVLTSMPKFYMLDEEIFPEVIENVFLSELL